MCVCVCVWPQNPIWKRAETNQTAAVKPRVLRFFSPPPPRHGNLFPSLSLAAVVEWVRGSSKGRGNMAAHLESPRRATLTCVAAKNTANGTSANVQPMNRCAPNGQPPPQRERERERERDPARRSTLFVGVSFSFRARRRVDRRVFFSSVFFLSRVPSLPTVLSVMIDELKKKGPGGQFARSLGRRSANISISRGDLRVLYCWR